MLSHDDIQAALSARLDGESYALDDDVIEAHVSQCSLCRQFQDQALTLRRTLAGESRSQGMAPPRDLADSILQGIEPHWAAAAAARQRALAISTFMLVAVGLLFLVWAVVTMVDAAGWSMWVDNGATLAPDADPEKAGLLIESAALRCGIGLGLIFAAFRPASAPGMLPVLSTMFMFLMGFTMRDIAVGSLDLDRVRTLAGLALAIAVLAGQWLSDRGYAMHTLWKELGSNPR